jgi:predicted Zn-dependent protease
MEQRSAGTAGGCAGLLAGLALACASPPPPTPAVPAWNAAPAPIVVADDERALWADAHRDLEKLEKEHSLLADEKLEGYLDGVLAGLLPPGLPPEMPAPRVRVLRAVERNAGAMADGTVLVSTSFLAALADESQLAALFGHELTHLLARHSLIDRRYEAETASTVQRLELSRAQEDEADRQGLELMERAGYEPRGALETLSLLAEDDTVARGTNPRFESHPFITVRVRTVRRAVSGLEPGRREQERYENAIADVLLVAAEGELEAGLLDRANAAIDRHLRLRPGSGRGYYWKAEHERRVAKEGRRSPEARRAYERAVELAPDDPDALRALGFLCRETGQPERARELLGHYLSVAPDAADRKLIQRYLGSEAP